MSFAITYLHCPSDGILIATECPTCKQITIAWGDKIIWPLLIRVIPTEQSGLRLALLIIADCGAHDAPKPRKHWLKRLLTM